MKATHLFLLAGMACGLMFGTPALAQSVPPPFVVQGATVADEPVAAPARVFPPADCSPEKPYIIWDSEENITKCVAAPSPEGVVVDDNGAPQGCPADKPLITYAEGKFKCVAAQKTKCRVCYQTVTEIRATRSITSPWKCAATQEEAVSIAGVGEGGGTVKMNLKLQCD